MVSPGTVAAIAASLMGQGENLSENAEIFQEHWKHVRKQRIRQFVALAVDIAQEAELQTPQPNKGTSK